jgi:tRNA (guanine-N7-)-methyltransferase
MRRRNGTPSAFSHPLLLDPFGEPEQHHAFRRWLDAPSPLHIEIGFGGGAYLLGLAAQLPAARLLGFEVKTRLVAELTARLERAGLEERTRLVQQDARLVVAQHIAPGSVDAFHVNFPDPWWKKRHQKRAITSAEFLEVMRRALGPSGALYFRTDVADLADATVERIRAVGGFAVEEVGENELPFTDRERKCVEFGLPVRRYRFRKVQS